VNDAPALAVTGLTRRIGGRTIVDAVDLDVDAGEVVVLVGPSGCGKSTTLRMIAGIEEASAGRVMLAGRDVTAEPPERRRIGLVFQEDALFGTMRVADNVAFGLRHMTRPERNERVTEMLDAVRLGHLARRYPHQLSGGEQQRVALARALAPSPVVMLLDEPFANLDEVLREEMRHEVVELLAGRSTAAVLVTHDRTEALALGHRVAVMSDGRILQCAPPDEVYARPASRFVATFMGQASLLDDPGGGVRVARPHDFRILPGEEDTVIERSYLGAVTRFRVRRADGSEIVVDDGGGTRLAVGDRCRVTFDIDALHRLP
jgi:iron(III) transport system ATP-binding protein